ncbi:MAG: sugar phosphate nucleotidyltransferase [Pseudomonadota bacterium]|nr:sugar phosphate nucleotidyltransferase [Pseudomonadota bacterium]
MRSVSNTWAVVLAGGEGNRLKELTTTAVGETIPKQYCSMQRDTCLLEDALKRAEAVALPQHICSVVAVQHRRWWSSTLEVLPVKNIFVQPDNRGTAHGIMLALLHIERRAPSSVVVLLPADHFVTDEATMARSLRTAANLAADNDDLVYLLGAEPDHPDQELGYIVPKAQRRDVATGVARFAEKPDAQKAHALIKEGALWNTFILAGAVPALLNLFAEHFAQTLEAMREALAAAQSGLVESAALELLYAGLESLDFSHDVLQCNEKMLQVLRVPSCGWTDLGTPKRVGETVRNLALLQSPTAPGGSATRARYLDLSLSRTQMRLSQAS